MTKVSNKAEICVATTNWKAASTHIRELVNKLTALCYKSPWKLALEIGASSARAKLGPSAEN